MLRHLKHEGREFWPSRHGYGRRNYSLNLNKDELARVKEAAFTDSLIPRPVIDAIVGKTLASGVCSGISCYTLYKFFGSVSADDDAQFLIAVWQARTWGRDFLRQAVYSYFLPSRRVLKEMQSGMGEEQQPEKLPLLVFLPRLFYLQNIIWAHTVIPFQWREGLENIYIGLYDSNYPVDDDRVLIFNKTSGFWQYEDKNSKEWLLTINYLGNLTRKVPFLL